MINWKKWISWRTIGQLVIIITIFVLLGPAYGLIAFVLFEAVLIGFSIYTHWDMIKPAFDNYIFLINYNMDLWLGKKKKKR
jgi:hypothetical protein